MRPKLLAPQELWNIFLKFCPMFAALIKLDIIKHSPVLFSSFWYILEYKIFFLACFISNIVKNGVVKNISPHNGVVKNISPHVNFCFQNTPNQPISFQTIPVQSIGFLTTPEHSISIKGLQGTGHLNTLLRGTTLTHHAKDKGNQS